MNELLVGGPTIAIVDDDASVRRSLLRVVQSAGYKAETFASAREFLEWLPANRAACLVLDVHMNEMTGFDLQERLAVPIIFMTAHDDASTLARIEKSGVAGRLYKPFDPPSVLRAIQEAVQARHERDGLNQATDPLSPPSSRDGSEGTGTEKP